MKNHPATSTEWLKEFGLPPKQEVFVLAYLKTHQGTAAARDAGYESPTQQVSRLLSNDKVRTGSVAGCNTVGNHILLNATGKAKHWADTAAKAPDSHVQEVLDTDRLLRVSTPYVSAATIPRKRQLESTGCEDAPRFASTGLCFENNDSSFRCAKNGDLPDGP